MLAETNRAPLTWPRPKAKLIAGAFTEYSGMGFGVYFMGEYANVVVSSSLLTYSFLAGGIARWGCGRVRTGMPSKLYAVIFTVIWVRWTFPRTTFYGLLNLSWKVLIPIALVNLLITSALLKVL